MWFEFLFLKTTIGHFKGGAVFTNLVSGFPVDQNTTAYDMADYRL